MIQADSQVSEVQRSVSDTPSTSLVIPDREWIHVVENETTKEVVLVSFSDEHICQHFVLILLCVIRNFESIRTISTSNSL